ncbi:DUF4166 domain-containing protein [Ramlibacter montanisoli]|uniref:DUF4166 domain-containing protein n=1 Tax=Ramlibacter montanisoli TaxID=2732512 RepID=UPI002815352D|nr:DUF4166 domain-containing protein [Ramlibacter montanisoli]
MEADAPASAPARLLAWCLGSPQRAHQGRLRFELDANPDAEVWTRHFPGKTMRSRLSGGPLLVEQLGPARLTFALAAADPGLVMRLVRLQFLRVPCPRWLMPHIVAEESGTGGRLNFRVHASVPVLGTVASYRGYLELPVAEDAP